MTTTAKNFDPAAYVDSIPDTIDKDELCGDLWEAYHGHTLDKQQKKEVKIIYNKVAAARNQETFKGRLLLIK